MLSYQLTFYAFPANGENVYGLNQNPDHLLPSNKTYDVKCSKRGGKVLLFLFNLDIKDLKQISGQYFLNRVHIL